MNSSFSVPSQFRSRSSRSGYFFASGDVQLVDPLVDRPPPRLDHSRRGDFELGLIHVVEEGEKLVILSLRDRVELVVVALAQPIVRPRNTVPVVLTRSTTDSTRNCSMSIPPSWLIGVLR